MTPPHTEGIKISANELRVLNELADFQQSYGYGYYTTYGNIAQELSCEKKKVRIYVRSLVRKGLAEYTRGLFDDDGGVAGSGHAITPAGLCALKSRAALGEKA